MMRQYIEEMAELDDKPLLVSIVRYLSSRKSFKELVMELDWSEVNTLQDVEEQLYQCTSCTHVWVFLKSILFG